MSIDLPFHKSWFDDNEINEVIETLKSGWLTTGPKTKRFEDDFKDYNQGPKIDFNCNLPFFMNDLSVKKT